MFISNHDFIVPIEDGKPGIQGPLVYQSGTWDKTKSYTRTAEMCPFVLYDTGNPDTDLYYYPTAIGTIAGSSTNKTPNQDSRWKAMNYFEAIFTKILIAKFGLLGSAVFHGDYMFSQYGTDANGNETSDYSGFTNGTFTPHYLVNLRTGELTANSANINSNGNRTGISISEGALKILDNPFGVGGRSEAAQLSYRGYATGLPNPNPSVVFALQANFKGLPKTGGDLPISKLNVGDLYVETDGTIKMKL